MYNEMRLKHYYEIKDKIEKRITELNNLIFGNPLSEVIEIRQKAQEIVKQHGNDYATISKLIEPLAKKEKVLLKQAKNQIDNDKKWMGELVNLKTELGEVKNHIWYMERGRAAPVI
jgi:hypothetical protein